jgi:hypothetical protein
MDFYTHFVCNEGLKKFLTFFLANIQKHKDFYDEEDAEDLSTEHAAVKTIVNEVLKTILAMYYRALKNQGEDTLSTSFLGKILAKDVFDLPKMIEMCEVYGRTNEKTLLWML